MDKIINYETFYFWDIETSRIPIDGMCGDTFDHLNYIQVPYLSNILSMDIKSGKIENSEFFRTIEDTVNYLNEISSEYNNIIVYVHNLDYELSFLLKQFPNASSLVGSKVDYYGTWEYDNVFREKHSPLTITLDIAPFVIFKDSYALFNKTVAQLGNDLVKRGEQLPKLDYNYTKIRTPWDKLETLDYDYNERDNIIVARSIYNYINDNNYAPKNIPLTFTSATKTQRRKYIQNNFDNAIRTINLDKHNVYSSKEFYQIQIDAYQGGTTTANGNITGKLIPNVLSADIKSSYPGQLLRYRYPIFLSKNTYKIEGCDANDFYHDFLHMVNHDELGTIKSNSNIKGYFARVIIENIEVKNENYLLPLSSSFCTNTLNKSNSTIINGKIKNAKRIEFSCNNVFLDILNKCYNYDNIYVYELYMTDKTRRLREGELSFLLNGFETKESSEKDTLEYILSKININSQYGMKVQKQLKDKYIIKNGNIDVIKYNQLDDCDIELTKEEVYERFEIFEDIKFNESGIFSKDFDIFSDGTYVTEYGRLQLIDMMIELVDAGCVPIYADTDSIKFYKENTRPKNKSSFNTNLNINDINNITQLINDVNNNIIDENKNNIRFINYKDKFNVEDNIFNKLTKVATWEIESTIKLLNDKEITHPYLYFKTLGAKKYALIKEVIYKKDDEYLNELLNDVKDLKQYKEGDKVQILETTIAGCKKTVNKCIMLYANKNNMSYADALVLIFDTGTLFDETASGRMIAYREKRTLEQCKEFTYKGRKLNSGGGTILQPSTYLLNVSNNDSEILGINRHDIPIRTINSKGELSYD